MVSLRWRHPYNALISAKRHAENGAGRPQTASWLRTTSLVVYALLMASVVAWKAWEIEASMHSAGKPVVVQLMRGPFTVLEFPSKQPVTRAILIFASGDGGWSGFEEEIALACQNNGYEVIGFNCFTYADTDYDLKTLQADFETIAQVAQKPFGAKPVPLIVGGWSMGAAQAIAVGGGPNPPSHLAGLLLLDPCSRGRYGLRLADRTDFLPTGDGTFGVDEFSATLGKARVVQWHADEDEIDSRAWLAGLRAAHREIDFPQTGHYYTRDRDSFLRQLIASVPWILSPPHDDVTSSGTKP